MFKPGQSGNPAGRPKGSRNKLAEDFTRALADDFEKFGPEVVEKVRIERPAEYMKICASLLPKNVELTGGEGGPIEGRVVFEFVRPEHKG